MSIAVNYEQTELEIVNVMIKPLNSNGVRYQPSIVQLLQGDNKIEVSDFNAHH